MQKIESAEMEAINRQMKRKQAFIKTTLELRENNYCCSQTLIHNSKYIVNKSCFRKQGNRKIMHYYDFNCNKKGPGLLLRRGKKKILSGMKAAANINITLSVLEIMGKNA